MANSVHTRQLVSFITTETMQTRENKRSEKRKKKKPLKRTLENSRLRSSIPTFYANFTLDIKNTQDRGKNGFIEFLKIKRKFSLTHELNDFSTLAH